MRTIPWHLSPDIAGSVGLVSVLRLGHWRWCRMVYFYICLMVLCWEVVMSKIYIFFPWKKQHIFCDGVSLCYFVSFCKVGQWVMSSFELKPSLVLCPMMNISVVMLLCHYACCQVTSLKWLCVEWYYDVAPASAVVIMVSRRGTRANTAQTHGQPNPKYFRYCQSVRPPFYP